MKLYQRLYEDLAADIRLGHLKPREKLLSIRQMMESRSLSRTTVELAYEGLVADGLVSCLSQSGYYVNEAMPQRAMEQEEYRPEPRFPYDFSGRYMDKNSFDFSLWCRMQRAVMEEDEAFYGYGAPQGEYALRKQIADYLAAGRGVYCSPDQIVIAASVQSLLHIFCQLISPQNRCIAFESPGFKKGHVIFKDHGYETVLIPCSEEGPDLSALASSTASLLYISPSHSFPTGFSLSYHQRMELLEWAREGERLIFEDDYDGELKYKGKPLASLMALDSHEKVVYLGTFSKLLPPSIRISYGVLPPMYLEKYKALGGLYNQTSATMEQLTLAHFMAQGQMERQLRRMRRMYSKKNRLLTSAFAQYFGEKASVSPNDTGLHLSVRFHLGLSSEEICQKAALVGIRLVPLSQYNLDETAETVADVYVSCASVGEGDIHKAIALLAGCFLA